MVQCPQDAFAGDHALYLSAQPGDVQSMPYIARPDEKRNFFETGYQMQNGVTFSGGDAKTKYYANTTRNALRKEQLGKTTGKKTSNSCSYSRNIC